MSAIEAGTDPAVVQPRLNELKMEREAAARDLTGMATTAALSFVVSEGRHVAWVDIGFRPVSHAIGLVINLSSKVLETGWYGPVHEVTRRETPTRKNSF